MFYFLPICAELERVRGSSSDCLVAEIDALKQGRRGQQEAGQWSALSVFKDRKLMLPMLLVIALQGGQQLSGVNAVSSGYFVIFVRKILNWDKIP